MFEVPSKFMFSSIPVVSLYWSTSEIAVAVRGTVARHRSVGALHQGEDQTASSRFMGPEPKTCPGACIPVIATREGFFWKPGIASMKLVTFHKKLARCVLLTKQLAYDREYAWEASTKTANDRPAHGGTGRSRTGSLLEPSQRQLEVMP